VKAWRSILQFEARSSFYTWLCSLTVNLVMESVRRKGRREEVELDNALPSLLPSPCVNYQRAEIREHLEAALARLSPEHRAAVVLQVQEDLQYHEIAEVLDLSVGIVSDVPDFPWQEETAVHVKILLPSNLRNTSRQFWPVDARSNRLSHWLKSGGDWVGLSRSTADKNSDTGY